MRRDLRVAEGRTPVSPLACNRRSFLAGSVLVGAVGAAGASAQEPTRREPPKPATGVRITVLKRTQELALQKKYVKGGVIPACGVVKDGQQFVARAPYDGEPDSMCKVAWSAMLESVKFVHGGSVDQMVVCCTDGYRPVFFLLDRIV